MRRGGHVCHGMLNEDVSYVGITFKEQHAVRLMARLEEVFFWGSMRQAGDPPLTSSLLTPRGPRRRSRRRLGLRRAAAASCTRSRPMRSPGRSPSPSLSRLQLTMTRWTPRQRSPAIRIRSEGARVLTITRAVSKCAQMPHTQLCMLARGLGCAFFV